MPEVSIEACISTTSGRAVIRNALACVIKYTTVL